MKCRLCGREGRPDSMTGKGQPRCLDTSACAERIWRAYRGLVAR